MNITKKMFLSAFRTAAIFALANMGATFIDGLITGHYLGSEAMAAVGLASPFFSISNTLCTCLGTGLIALAAHSLGSGDERELNNYFNSALWTMAAVSVVLMVVFLLWAEPIALVFGARSSDSALVENSAAYIRGLAWGIPTFLLSGLTSQAIGMDGGGKLVKCSAVCCLITDGVFDMLSVHFGWGLYGIGLATSVSTVVKFGILFGHFTGKKTGEIRITRMMPNFSHVLNMIKSGSDTLVLSAINIFKPIILNSLIISVGGSAALSVMSVYNNLNGFATFICSGLLSALSVTAGMLYGEINRRDIVRIAAFAQKLVLIFYLPVILILTIFSGEIAQYYLPDLSAGKDMMVFALYCLAFCLVPYSMIFLRIRYLQTVDQLRKARVLTFFANFGVVILCAYLASISLGAYGIIASNAVSSVVCILGIIILTQCRAKKFFVTSDDYLCLPETFYAKGEVSADFSLKSSEPIEAVMSGITDFCKDNAQGHTAIATLPLCVEKILLRLSEIDAKPGNVRPDMSISAAIHDETCRLIIRDDGPERDISEKALTDELAGMINAPCTVNIHRVLNYNSLILAIR